MVNQFSSCLILLILYVFFAHAQVLQGLEEVKVTAVIDQDKLYENQPLKGLISITHNKNKQIDSSSFLMGGQPLKVDFVQDVDISPPNPLVLSYYRFALPGQPAGLYLLPEVSVKIGGNAYSSIASTYVVEAAKPVQPSKAPHEKEEKGKEKIETGKEKEETGKAAFLKLELKVENAQQLYPGQRFQVTYRYLFNQDIELNEEKLPLLNPEGFAKVGTKAVKGYQEEATSVQEVTQMLEAQKPGDYAQAASHIAGYVYTTDFLGNRQYQKPLLEATAPAMTLIVSPFPEQGKPASFNGAIGPFDLFKASLKSPSSIFVGDKIELGIEMGGKGQVDNAPLPELCCQPGFSGVFKLSDLPPVKELSDNVLHFTVEIRPLTASIKEIPAIEFSYFIPQEGKYGVLHSDPIPIKINPLPIPPKEETQPAPGPQQEEGGWRSSSLKGAKIEISGNLPLAVSDLYNLPFGTWSVLYVIPFGILGAAFQLALRRYLLQRKSKVRPKTSADYFKEALQAPPDSPLCYHLLNKAFRMRLVEKKVISAEDADLDRLSSSGVVGEVCSFLRTLEEQRFTGREQPLSHDQMDQARQLFKRLEHEVNP